MHIINESSDGSYSNRHSANKPLWFVMLLCWLVLLGACAPTAQQHSEYSGEKIHYQTSEYQPEHSYVQMASGISVARIRQNNRMLEKDLFLWENW